jgi:hypothetical protein
MATPTNSTIHVLKAPEPDRLLRKRRNAEHQAKWRRKRNQLAKAAEAQAQQPKRAPSPGNRRAMQRQTWAAAAVCTVAVVLTALSLSHLAHGVRLVTGCPDWEAWALAAGVDLGLVACEISMLAAATDKVRREIGAYAKAAIVGTLIASAVMNALAFSAQSTGWLVWPAVGLGIAIPGMVYALSRIAFGLAASK